jgi:GMP synthase-like glutamine amidotransferase
MKALILQHVPFEGPGSIEHWLRARDATIQYSRFYQSCTLPDIATVDLVIAMGGPMSVNDEAQYPWLKAEKAFIREAVRRGLPVVGICLGAQLIASALGASVHANGEKEIGWFPIEATASAPAAFRFPARATVFHWHGETFALPVGAIHLASSAACTNQAFQLGKNVIGLQFHLETTPATAELLLQNCGHELIDATYIQSAQTIRAAPDTAYAAIHRLMDDVLSYVTAA